MQRISGFKRFVRHSAEITGGLMIANIGDSINVFLMSIFLSFLTRHKYLLALLPALSALRGSNATSMASRITSSLYLGSLKPKVSEIVRREYLRILSLGLLASLYAATLVWITTEFSFSPRVLVGVGEITAIIALSILVPVTGALAVYGFRAGLNPDNYLASVLTVLGDMTSIPSLVLAGLIMGVDPRHDTLVSLVLTYVGLVIVFSTLIGWPKHRRVIGETLTALLMVGLIESQTGALFDKYSSILVSLGVIQMVPSLMEDIGASLSVYAARATTLIHFGGFEETARATPGILAEVIAGTLPAVFVLSGIGYMSLQVAQLSASFQFILSLVFVLWIGMLLLYVPLVMGLAYFAVRLGLDPDNFTIPLITSIVDVSTIPFIILISKII